MKYTEIDINIDIIWKVNKNFPILWLLWTCPYIYIFYPYFILSYSTPGWRISSLIPAPITPGSCSSKPIAVGNLGPEWSDHGIPWENPWRIWEVPPGTKKRLGETQLDSMIWSFWLYGCVWTWGITMDYCSCVLWPFNEAWTIMDSYGFCVQNLWSLGIPFWWNFRHIYQICRLQILATASKPNFPRSWRFFPWPGAAHLIHDVPPVAVPCNYGPWWLKRWEFWECNIMVFAKDFLQAVSIHIVI